MEKEPATEKQKQYLTDLACRKGFQIATEYLDLLSKKEASRMIEALLEGD